jgi:predicted membrane-bound spermidine synthase
MSYFERPLPTGLILGSFFAVFLPLVLLQLVPNTFAWLPYVLMVQAVGLGTTHFFITLSVYLHSSNLDHFASTWRNRIVYFAVPALILLLFAWSEAAQFRTAQPVLAAYVFGGLRFLDFFHVGRQSVGMLQLFKRRLPEGLAGWARPLENAFFVGMALMQWQTFLLGGRFAASKLYAVVPAIALGALFLMLAIEHVQAARRGAGGPRRFVPLSYFAMQAVCAAAAVYETRLYLVALTLHYVEYHVIMVPRWFHSPLRPERAIDRVAGWLRGRALLFYGALIAVVVLFELRTRVPGDVSATTTFFVHMFDGIFLLHYFVEAFLWKFGSPFYRQALGPLYFGPWPPGAQVAAAPAVSSGPVAKVEPAASNRGPASTRPDARTLLLCTAFFVSGASALAFETLWFHQAGLAFGNSVWASSLVLAGFMAGMALGNALAARLGDRLRSSTLRAYARLELLIAVAGVALVHVLPWSGGLLGPFASALAGQPGLLNALRLLAAFVLLGIPSTAMGMTLPLLVRAVRGWDANFGRVLGVLYGANTAGAVLGVLGAEAFLLPALGIRASAWLAGALNLAAAVAAWLLAARARDGSETHVAGPAGAGPGPRAAGLHYLIAAFASGFALLALEVIWLRFALLFINDTPLAFAVMLATVLAGIAAGSFAASAAASRFSRMPAHAPLVAYAAALAGLAGYLLYPHVLERWYSPDQDFATIALVISPLVLPASFASGALFAVLGAALRGVEPSDARAAGRLTFANTLGAGLGSLCAGFVLLPRLGMERSFFALFALYGAIGLCAGLGRELGAALRYGGLALVAVALSFFPFGKMESSYVRVSAGRWMSPGDRVAEVREGLTGTLVHVVHGAHGLRLFDQLATNAYSMSVNDFAGRRYMKLFVLLPRAIHPRIRRALVVGYGIGNTVEALTDAAELERIDLVDISSDTLRLGRRIPPSGGRHPLDDPRVHVHVEDGRHFLQGSKGGYDLITGEPPPPVMAGVVNLYTREYFALLHDRLAEGGIATYWLPIMNISAATAGSLIAAFCAAFEDCSLWHGSSGNFMLMGTRGAGASGPVAEDVFTRAWNDPGASQELQAIGVELPGQLGALFIGDAAYLADLTRDADPIADDDPKLMHQPGTRDEREALTWAWRDTAAARRRFFQSPLIERLWPASLRRESLRHFENQRLLNDLLFPGQTNARQTGVLHQVLHGTTLRLPVLLMLGSDPDIQRALRSAPPAERERPEWRVHRAALSLAERDFASASALLEGVPQRELPLPDLREYVRQMAARR